MKKSTELFIQDLLKNHKLHSGTQYLNEVYEDSDPNLKEVFIYFHSNFNGLFDFMNAKYQQNGHFNSFESQQLIHLIKEYNDLTNLLQKDGIEILISDEYKNHITVSDTFLSLSWGSKIPIDYKQLQIVKFDPIFEIKNSHINIKERGDKFELKLIGEGAFSIVHSYKDEYLNRRFAIKTAKKNSEERELERFRKEYDILSKLNFPYILEVYRFLDDENKYVMEYCDLTLCKYMGKNNSTLPISTRKRILLQFLYGIYYLHTKGILHRDLSYNNVLVKLFDAGAITIKLSDFGLHKDNESNFTLTDSNIKGTIIDPALLSFKDYNVTNEMYSVGHIINFIFTGRKSINPAENQIFEIINKCINPDTSKRYKSILEIINDINKIIITE